MRIAYISGAYIPSREANTMHVMRMCQAFADNGHEVTLVARPGSEPAPDDFAFYGVRPVFEIVKLARPQVRVYGALAHAAYIARYFRAHKPPDLVYSRDIYGLWSLVPNGAPFVYESHWKPKHFVQRALEGRLFERPNFRRLVLISQALKSIYEREFASLAPQRMLVAHDAADPVPRGAHAARTVAVDRLQVGYVGSFLRGYGQELIESLARRMPNADFHVVGGQEDQIREWRERTRALPNLTFHGFVAPAHLGELYARFDVMLAPYQARTAHIRWISPMKLFEYMAYGKAIVCSDFSVMREILQEGVTGLLVPATDIGAWQRAIESLQDSVFRERMGDAARNELERHYTWKARAERALAGI